MYRPCRYSVICSVDKSLLFGGYATQLLHLFTYFLLSNFNKLFILYLGISFGIGAVIIPALVFGVGMAYFGQRIRYILHDWRIPLERASAILLMIIGSNSIVGAELLQIN